MYRLDTGGQPYQCHGVQREVEEAARAHQHQHDIVPRQVVHPHMVLAGGEIEEADDHDAAHEQREPNLRHILGKEGHDDAEYAEQGHQHTDDHLGRTLPHTGGGFAVVFPHHRVQIRGLPGSGIRPCRRTGIRLFLLYAHSRFSPNSFRIMRGLRREPPPQPRKVLNPR